MDCFAQDMGGASLTLLGLWGLLGGQAKKAHVNIHAQLSTVLRYLTLDALSIFNSPLNPGP